MDIEKGEPKQDNIAPIRDKILKLVNPDSHRPKSRTPSPTLEPEKSNHTKVKIETTEKLRKNNGWNSINEQEALNLSQLAQAYSWLHHKSHRLKADYDTTITVIIMLISTSLILTQLVLDPSKKQQKILQVFTVILNFLITGLTGYSHIMDYSGNSLLHKQLAQYFGEIHDTIRQQLQLYRRDRQNAAEFISYQSQILDIYMLNSPDIDDAVIKLFKEKFKNIKIQLPVFMNDNIEQFMHLLPDENGIKSSNTDSVDDIAGSADVQNNTPSKKLSSLVLRQRNSKVIPMNVGKEPDESDSESDNETIKTPRNNSLNRAKIEISRLNANLNLIN